RSRATGCDVGGEGRRLWQCRAAHAVLAPACKRARRSAFRLVAARRILEAVQDGGSVARRTARQKARVQGQDPLRLASPQWTGAQVPADGYGSGLRKRGSQGIQFLSAEGIVRGVRGVRARAWSRSRAVRRVSQGTRTSLAGGERQGNEVAIQRRQRSLRES